MKKILFILSICLFSLSLLSQSCCPEGITFTTQTQIDSFQINYPNCTEIEGDVEFYGYNDINNLNSLNVLTSIGGDVWFQNNNALVNLTGLENLTSILGDLTIGGLWYLGNDSLQNLTGLNNLTNIGGTLNISDNPLLQSLTGLESLTSIDGNLLVGNCLAKSEKTDSLRGGNTSLKNLAGLSNLSSLGGSIIIECNDSLNSLTGLEKLDSIEGLVLTSNQSLQSLQGLDNLTYIGEDITIYYNELLSACDIESICNYLVVPNGTVNIHDNAEGCNSQQEIEDACSSSINEIGALSILAVTPNPFTTSTNLSYDLKQPSTVQLSVFNQLGQLVYQHTEEQQQGEQKLQWDAQGLAEGIYYYRLEVGDQVANGKMVKVR